ncbi:hypothetical protein CEXT_773451 [Caerostris extrusa]|uniref:Uncharacterized protein n=1 Tax=Caerostris extrusa TaxID=172846 RepID=A0AAV4PBJ1_CAEEX|nr:hypothetical protein CEXT_773451 [Caerostris extrusa]
MNNAKCSRIPQLENTITGSDCCKRREYPSAKAYDCWVPQPENTITGRDCGKRREYPTRRSLRLLVKNPLVISGFWNKRFLSKHNNRAIEETPPNQLIDSTVIILSLRKIPFHEPDPNPKPPKTPKWTLGRDI